MTGSMWFSVVFAWAVGVMTGLLLRWPRPNRPDYGPIFARRVHDAMPRRSLALDHNSFAHAMRDVDDDECELPISTPCNQELLTLAAKHQPPQHWYEETDNPHAQVYCPSCCGTHRSDESCGCER